MLGLGAGGESCWQTALRVTHVVCTPLSTGLVHLLSGSSFFARCVLCPGALPSSRWAAGSRLCSRYSFPQRGPLHEHSGAHPVAGRLHRGLHCGGPSGCAPHPQWAVPLPLGEPAAGAHLRAPPAGAGPVGEGAEAGASGRALLLAATQTPQSPLRTDPTQMLFFTLPVVGLQPDIPALCLLGLVSIPALGPVPWAAEQVRRGACGSPALLLGPRWAEGEVVPSSAALWLASCRARRWARPGLTLCLSVQVTLSYGMFENKRNAVHIKGPFSVEVDPSR